MNDFNVYTNVGDFKGQDEEENVVYWDCTYVWCNGVGGGTGGTHTAEVVVHWLHTCTTGTRTEVGQSYCCSPDVTNFGHLTVGSPTASTVCTAKGTM